jgi:NAD(P)-dependent dehydrogenase (short-subunit alcohol dehydrogenase family)
MMKMTTQKMLALAVAGAALATSRHLLRRRRAIHFRARTVLIVGGSRGLGLVLARQLADEGACLALMARDAAELDRAREELEARGVPVMAVAADVRDPMAVESAVATVVENYGGLDVLINNAGVIQVGPLEHMTVEDFENAMATHFWGPLYTTLAALPHMRRHGARRIVNISSIGGKIAVPHLLPYSASKFALAGLSAGLRSELAQEGFRVTSVFPGLMRTGSTYNALFKGQHRREFAWFHVADSLPGLSTAAESAARRIVEACRYGDPELVITLPARLAVLASAVMPNTVAHALALTNRILPAGSTTNGQQSQSGWQSVSTVAPSVVTRLADKATLDNNEMPLPTFLGTRR